MYPRGGVVPAGDVDEHLILPRQAVGMLGYARVIAEPGNRFKKQIMHHSAKFQAPPKAVDFLLIL